MTARFGRNHDDAIAELLNNSVHFHRYVFPDRLKNDLLRALREQYGVWEGALFPDVAGAASVAKSVFSNNGV